MCIKITIKNCQEYVYCSSELPRLIKFRHPKSKVAVHTLDEMLDNKFYSYNLTIDSIRSVLIS